MKTIPRNENNYLDDIDPQDEHLPDFVKVAAKNKTLLLELMFTASITIVT